MDRAQRAQAVMDNPAFKDAFAGVREAIIARIEQCPMRDTEGAERLRIMLKLLNDVRANLEQALADGKVAGLRLQEVEETKKRRFAIFR